MHSPAKTKMHRKRQGDGRPRALPVRSAARRRVIAGRAPSPRGASQGFRSKKVRAKDIMTPHIETSRSDRAAPLRSAGEVGFRKCRREAANWLGGVNSKCGDLPLFQSKSI
ncbi:MAG: hypothetical protein Q8P01_02300 [bacterium]|nr:hypothetical protein [bacterium]